MANTSAKFSLTAAIAALLSAGNVGSNTLNLNFGLPSIAFSAPGPGAGTYNSCYIGSRTVTTGTPDILNLTSGLLNPDGTAAAFADIVAIGLYNRSTTGGQTMTLGGGTNPVISYLTAATGIAVIPPGGVFIMVNPNATGYAVTPTTADKINVNVAAGSAVPYDFILLGH